MTDPVCEAAQNGAAETSSPAESPRGAEARPVDRMDHMRERIRQLPPEVGAVLMTAGVVGLILPGPVGTPLVLAGGLVLMPRTFSRWEKWFAKRFPTMHEHGMRHVDRFIDDFERRYPKQTPQNESTSPSD